VVLIKKADYRQIAKILTKKKEESRGVGEKKKQQVVRKVKFKRRSLLNLKRGNMYNAKKKKKPPGLGL